MVKEPIQAVSLTVKNELQLVLDKVHDASDISISQSVVRFWTTQQSCDAISESLEWESQSVIHVYFPVVTKLLLVLYCRTFTSYVIYPGF